MTVNNQPDPFEFSEADTHLAKQATTVQKRKQLQQNSIQGCEAKPLPYLLVNMNLLLHGLESPDIDPGNALRFPLKEMGDRERVDVILSNPPFGGEEERGILGNFPDDKQTAETALLFLQLIMRKLRRQPAGRAAVVVPNGTLFTDGICGRIKQELLTEFNLHTIVRLPNGVFAPYTNIPANLLFFDRTGPTKDVWFYEQPLPEGRKNYTKTQPLQFEEFEPLIQWWCGKGATATTGFTAREENTQAWKIPAADILANGCNLDRKNSTAIPHSAEMVQQIENLIEKDWSQFKDLYNYVRSAIFYADGIRGTFDGNVSYNIERLVVALDELSRREEHPLYPFIGAWNHRLSQVAGIDFCNVAEFKTKILEKLRTQWIEIDNYEKADYFQGLARFQKQLNFPLHVFTLNYDLCVEKAFSAVHNKWPERGFGSDRFWSHGLLDEATSESPSMYLYKLHGSIDWIRDKDSGKLTYSDSTSKIPANEGELIFGTTYKLQYVDPFLFLVYQLRRLSLEAKLMVVVGYGFGDEHINGILKQALRGESNKRVVVASYFGDKAGEELDRAKQKYSAVIETQLGLHAGSNKLVVVALKAHDFLGEHLTIEEMEKHFPVEDSLFEVLPSDPPAQPSEDQE